MTECGDPAKIQRECKENAGKCKILQMQCLTQGNALVIQVFRHYTVKGS